MKKKRDISHWKKKSKELDKEMSGDVKNTEPLTNDDKIWIREALIEQGPMIPITLRLQKWQIERAKQIARNKNIKGYQTLIRQILTRALI